MLNNNWSRGFIIALAILNIAIIVGLIVLVANADKLPKCPQQWLGICQDERK